MRISEAAQAAGVNVETLRYYERRGLLQQPHRPAAGYRDYSGEVVRLVRFIKQAQDLGFTLDEIEELARLRGTTARGRERVRAVAERTLAELEHKIAQLRNMETVLRRLIAACREGNTPECPILEAISSDAGSAQPHLDVSRQPPDAPVRRRVRKDRPGDRPTRHQTRSAT